MTNGKNGLKPEMTKPVLEYRESIIAGLTWRQLMSLILTVGSAALVYALMKRLTPEEISSWVCMMPGAVFVFIGFAKLDGKPVEKFLKRVFVSKTRPLKRVYLPEIPLYDFLTDDENQKTVRLPRGKITVTVMETHGETKNVPLPNETVEIAAKNDIYESGELKFSAGEIAASGMTDKEGSMSTSAVLPLGEYIVKAAGTETEVNLLIEHDARVKRLMAEKEAEGRNGSDVWLSAYLEASEPEVEVIIELEEENAEGGQTMREHNGKEN